jgi:hypothetical protein
MWRRGVLAMCMGVASACGSSAETPDAVRPADAPVDATDTVDSSVDAFVVDALVVEDAPDMDAGVDAVPTGCVPTTELMVNLAPFRITAMISDGTRLITSEVEYDINHDPIGSRVVYRELGETVFTEIPVVGSPLALIDGWVYFAGANGIFRWQFGQTVESVVAGADLYGPITANTSHLYWGTTTDEVHRRPLDGGPTEVFATEVDTTSLLANDSTLYVGVPQRIWGYPLDGGERFTVADQSSLIPWDLVEDAGILYWPDFFRSVWRYDPAVGNEILVASQDPDLTRPIDIVIRGLRIYVLDQGVSGIYRAPKTATAGNLVRATPTTASASFGMAFIGSYLHWGNQSELWRCNVQN